MQNSITILVPSKIFQWPSHMIYFISIIEISNCKQKLMNKHIVIIIWLDFAAWKAQGSITRLFSCSFGIQFTTKPLFSRMFFSHMPHVDWLIPFQVILRFQEVLLKKRQKVFFNVFFYLAAGTFYQCYLGFSTIPFLCKTIISSHLTTRDKYVVKSNIWI